MSPEDIPAVAVTVPVQRVGKVVMLTQELLDDAEAMKHVTRRLRADLDEFLADHDLRAVSSVSIGITREVMPRLAYRTRWERLRDWLLRRPAPLAPPLYALRADLQAAPLGCRSCASTGFRLTDGRCDGCREANR